MHGTLGGLKCRGFVLFVFGVLFFLGTLGVWPEFTFMKYWPLLLVVAGLHDLFCKCGGSMAGCGCGKQ
ncbi:hypothetical protein HYW83_04945 [Candidatus Peregrinibacteria bacterium]|nr:hypothetical protein [Candidatus Peregrinibacteria bacterium]